MQSPFRALYEERMLLDSDDAPGGVIAYYADGDEEIIHVNNYVLRLLECADVDEFLDLTQGSFRNFVYEDDLDATEDSIWGQVKQHEGLDHVYYRVKTKTGRLVSVVDYGRLVHSPDRARPLFHALVSEVTPEATVDWLTGLPSMLRFHDLARLGAATLFARDEVPVAVSLDIMGMKSFNTRYGREEGDRLLRALAEVLRTHFGAEACSRFAEDHYYAFATSSDIESRIQAVFDDFRAQDFDRVPPVRAGLYACGPNEDIVDVGFDRAKAACDLDRKTYGSHFMWFTDEMRAAARVREHVLESLDRAIAEGWIRPYYQAIVRSATGDVCNEEALARWIDPEFGSLFPNQFIPDLEEAGLLYKLDLHIVDCVIADMVVKNQHNVSIVPVSMNFSLRDLMQLDLAHEIAQRADAAGLPRSLFRIELTESVASSDPDFLRAQIAAMHEAGFEVWMDDFGSGYSSLNTLQEFNFDLIKLDMGFLRSNEVERSHVILAGVVQAAAVLGVGTLTEGVETKEQAEFLASIGCDMLQGYFYARPNDIDEIISYANETLGRCREPYLEKEYWNAVSLVSFTNMTPVDESSDWAPMTESPIAVLERRDGRWFILRANQSYIDFLHAAGLLPEGETSHLGVLPVNYLIDTEFDAAVDKSLTTARWERIFGIVEYGTGYQFYVRHVAGTRNADAFIVAAVPTMLGAGLGIYGDVPVAYAVFRVELSDEGDEVVDAEYVYANNSYCEWTAVTPDEVIGRSFLEVYPDSGDLWFPNCYRAVVLGEKVHEIVYSPEAGHWLSVNVAPSLIEGCCVFAFSLADDERREHEEMKMGLDTSDFIIRIVDAFNGETDYDTAMNRMLEAMSEVIHPDRLYVVERGTHMASNTFEWCAEGVSPQIGTLQDMDIEDFSTWDLLLEKDEVVLIPNVDDFKDVDRRMHWQLTRQGITHMLAVPFYDGDQLLGYLRADNYMLEDELDSIRVLTTVASFVSARIVNHRLLDRLERLGTRDDLTGMLSRRGIDLAVDAYMAEHAGEPFGLALMDVDGFKLVNDMYGHGVGDSALRTIARCVERAFPLGSIVGRNGGDEFMALVPGKDAQRMEACVQNLVNGNLSCEYEGSWYHMSLSIGYVLYPEQADSLRAAYSKANAALYAVKLGGKSGYKRYHPSMEAQYRSQTGFRPRDIAESLPGAIMVHRPNDGEILFVNDEMVSLFECDGLEDFMEYTGGTFSGIVHPEDRVRVHDELAAQQQLGTMRVGDKDYVDFRILTKKGNVRNVANNGRLVEVRGMGEVFYELIINYDERGER